MIDICLKCPHQFGLLAALQKLTLALKSWHWIEKISIFTPSLFHVMFKWSTGWLLGCVGLEINPWLCIWGNTGLASRPYLKDTLSGPMAHTWPPSLFYFSSFTSAKAHCLVRSRDKKEMADKTTTVKKLVTHRLIYEGLFWVMYSWVRPFGAWRGEMAFRAGRKNYTTVCFHGNKYG